MQRWSEFREHNGLRKLFVDGRPFLALGIQIDFLNCTKVEDFDWLFPHIVKMGCNTVYFPVRWFVVEPTEGSFDWTVLDHALARCRESNLRMCVLWFGSNQGGACRPAPAGVKEDAARFPRLCDPAGNPVANALCPSSPELLSAERRALGAMLSHLGKVDGAQHTTILMQVENEPCITMDHERPARKSRDGMDQWQPRCFCPVCNDLVGQASSLSRRDDSLEGCPTRDWEFGVLSLGGYIDRLLHGLRDAFPIPAYVNFPINPLRPGEDVDLYLEHFADIDAVAPDYYGFSPNDLAFTCRYFRRGRNPLLIAEHSTESVGDADINLFLAVAEHGACAFDPWAIDHAFGWRAWRDHVSERPMVVRDGSWTDAAIAYGRALSSITAATAPIAQAQGGDDLFFYVSPRIPRKIEEKRWGLRWLMLAGKDGKWIAARSGEGDVTIVGNDTRVIIEPVGAANLTIEVGRWVGQEWKPEGTVQPADRPSVCMFDLEPGKAWRVRS